MHLLHHFSRIDSYCFCDWFNTFFVILGVGVVSVFHHLRKKHGKFVSSHWVCEISIMLFNL